MAYRYSIIKSIQTGTIAVNGTTSNTATITSVSTSNAVVLYGGHAFGASATSVAPASYTLKLTLTNATTVTAACSASDSRTVAYTVLEFVPNVIKSLQTFTVTIAASSTSSTATITSVATGKTILVYQGTDYTSGGVSTWPEAFGDIVLTNATTVTGTRNDGTTGQLVLVGTAVEFK